MIPIINPNSATKEERRRFANNELERQKNILRGEGIEVKSDRNVLLGKYNNEPFAIFIMWKVGSNGEYVGWLTTRYNGKDHYAKKPMDVLKG